MVRDKRFWLTVLLLACLALSFWLYSRYPALHDKAEAGPNMVLDGIGFDTVYQVEPGDSLAVQVGKRTVNWVRTNQKGMLFGLLMAAAMATLLSLLQANRSGRWRDTLLGVAIGAPMGLCVNCAAPLATSLRGGRAAEETLMAAVVSSPTLNFIVISILFSMLPWHLAVLKLGATVFFLLVLVPAIATYSRQQVPQDELRLVSSPPAWQGGWGEALLWLAHHFSGHFLRMSLRLVPLMLLAGALGSLLISLLPWEIFRAQSQVDPVRLAAVAVVGTLLPVPMAFDVIMCGLLYQSGMAVEYVAALSFTLGTFSFLSFTVFWTTVSRRMALAMFVSVALMGWGCGLLAGRLDGAYRRALDERLQSALRQAQSSQPVIPSGLPAQSVERTPVETPKRAFRPAQGTDKALFTRLSGPSLGLSTPQVISYREHQTEPALANRSIAGGDVHRDGWTDVVVANDYEVGGATLFANLEGRFVRQRLDLGEFNRVFLPVVALVDVDGDGWLDLFFSTFHGQNRLMLNQRGQFGKMVELPSLPGAFVSAAGFADVDRDGRVDMVLGSWVHRIARTGLERLRNYTLRQTGPLTFELRPLPLPGGNTQALLISDLNADGFQDLVLGNDWSPVDEFYLGSAGGWQPLDGRVIPATSEWTMSIDSADLDNDGKLEIFLSQIAYGQKLRERGPRERVARKQKLNELLSPEEVGPVTYMRAGQVLHENLRYRQDPVLVDQASKWIKPEVRMQALLDILYFRVAGGDGQQRQRWQSLLPQDDQNASSIFQAVFPTTGDAPQYPAGFTPIPSHKIANVLLAQRGGGYEDRAEAWDVAFTNWGWNARFADLDGDGFVDLYLVNGAFEQELLTTNLLFLNRQGQRLERVEEEGTRDFFPCSNYTYLDFDNDGDLDILLNPPNGDMRMLRNNSRSHWLAFDLEGGLGARLRLHTGAGVQQREVKASGGFDSFDAPTVYFGLGGELEAGDLEVVWPDGSEQKLSGPWPAGNLYRIKSARPSSRPTRASKGGRGKS